MVELATRPTTTTLSALQTLKEGKWVCFDANKVPYTPTTGYPAKADEPSTWETYDDARQALKSENGRYAGIGREFIKEDKITGVDLDKCIDENGIIAPWAQAIIDRLNSYTEKSPSKHGIHIWVYGSVPKNIGAGDDHIEIYDCKRYFTVTGNHLPGTPTTIEERQDVLDALHSETIERRRKAKEAKRKPATQAKSYTTNNGTPYGLKALEQECDIMRSTHEGGRNQQLNNSAFSIGQLIAGQEIDEQYAISELYNAALQAGLDDAEIKKTLNSGLYGGMAQPRKAPAQSVENAYQEMKASRTSATDAIIPLSFVPKEDSNLPHIILGDQLRDTRQTALNALMLKENADPSLFIQTAKIKRIGRDELLRPIIVDVGESELRNALTDSANYYRINAKDLPVPVAPPKEVVQSIIGLKTEALPFPAIEAIVQTPIMRSDGTILDTPGYDAQTRLYYMPQHGLTIPAIPCRPTQAEVREAMKFVQSFSQDFPFESQSDRANELGLMLTTVTRHMFRHVPIALIDATKQGTGKGLLTDKVAITATGRSASAISQVSSDEEWDKRITAMLMSGATMITIDNVEGVLRSPILSKILTSEYHNGRVLGESKMVDVPQKAIWIANGNNIQLGGDMPRRCYRIRMISKVSNPYEREDFKYEHLDEEVKKQRGNIIAALLTIARGWYIAGQPKPTTKIKKLATFSKWAEVIGGMLSYAGVDGFLENLDDLHKDIDVDGAAWTLFLEKWLEVLGTDAYTTKVLLEKINALPELADVLPEPLATLYAKEDKTLKNKIGKTLAKKNGTPFGSKNLRIVQGLDTHSKVATYQVAGYCIESPNNQAQKAGFAGFAGSDLTYAQGENFDTDVSTKSDNNIHMDGKVNLSPQTPQTPQIEHKQKEIAFNTPQNNSEPEEIRQLRDKLTQAKRSSILWKGDYLPRENYLARLQAGLESDDMMLQNAAIAEITKQLGV